jgi:hypothetical protein
MYVIISNTVREACSVIKFGSNTDTIYSLGSHAHLHLPELSGLNNTNVIYSGILLRSAKSKKNSKS